MEETIDLKLAHETIQSLKRTAEALQMLGAGFPALEKNVARILATVKMLELNVSDLLTDTDAPFST